LSISGNEHSPGLKQPWARICELLWSSMSKTKIFRTYCAKHRATVKCARRGKAGAVARNSSSRFPQAAKQAWRLCATRRVKGCLPQPRSRRWPEQIQANRRERVLASLPKKKARRFSRPPRQLYPQEERGIQRGKYRGFALRWQCAVSHQKQR
jgi:hypothetical protein